MNKRIDGNKRVNEIKEIETISKDELITLATGDAIEEVLDNGREITQNNDPVEYLKNEIASSRMGSVNSRALERSITANLTKRVIETRLIIADKKLLPVDKILSRYDFGEIADGEGIEFYYNNTLKATEVKKNFVPTDAEALAMEYEVLSDKVVYDDTKSYQVSLLVRRDDYSIFTTGKNVSIETLLGNQIAQISDTLGMIKRSQMIKTLNARQAEAVNVITKNVSSSSTNPVLEAISNLYDSIAELQNRMITDKLNFKIASTGKPFLSAYIKDNFYMLMPTSIINKWKRSGSGIFNYDLAFGDAENSPLPEIIPLPTSVYNATTAKEEELTWPQDEIIFMHKNHALVYATIFQANGEDNYAYNGTKVITNRIFPLCDIPDRALLFKFKSDGFTKTSA